MLPEDRPEIGMSADETSFKFADESFDLFIGNGQRRSTISRARLISPGKNSRVIMRLGSGVNAIGKRSTKIGIGTSSLSRLMVGDRVRGFR